MNTFSSIVAFFAVSILVSVLFLTPEVSMEDGFVEYIVYGPGPWGWGGRGHAWGLRPWHRCRFCPHRRRFVYGVY